MSCKSILELELCEDLYNANLHEVNNVEQFIDNSKAAGDQRRNRDSRLGFSLLQVNRAVLVGCEDLLAWLVDDIFLLQPPTTPCGVVCQSHQSPDCWFTEKPSAANVLDFPVIGENPLFLIKT